MKEMSLSMVLGMPITLIFNPRRPISPAMAWAPLERPVPADGKQDADIQADQSVHHVADILVSPGGAQNGAAHFMDGPHRLWGQFQGSVIVLWTEPLVAVAEAQHLPYPVLLKEGQDDGPDDVVQPRT